MAEKRVFFCVREGVLKGFGLGFQLLRVVVGWGGARPQQDLSKTLVRPYQGVDWRGKVTLKKGVFSSFGVWGFFCALYTKICNSVTDSVGHSYVKKVIKQNTQNEQLNQIFYTQIMALLSKFTFGLIAKGQRDKGTKIFQAKFN